MVVYSSNSNTLERKAQGWEIQNHPQLHSEFQANWTTKDLVIKKKKKNEEFSTAAANALLPLSLFDDEGKTDAGADEVAKRERKSVAAERRE